MQEYIITKGDTSKIITVSVYDSSSTTGAKLAGLLFNSASLTAYYNRAGAAGAATAITLVTATKGTWVSSGFVAVDGTNMPGDYELHIPDAVIASGVDEVDIQLKGATNMVPVNIKIHLIAQDLQVASVAQTGDSYARIGAAGASLTDLGGMSTAMKAQVNTEADTALTDYDGPTNAEMIARTRLDADYFSWATDTVANVTLVATATAVTNQVTADITALNGNATSAVNIDFQYDGATGLIGDFYPSSQAQVGNLAVGSASVSVTAESFTKSGAEPETNTYTSTHALDGVVHLVEDVAGAIDCYYQFDVGTEGVPTEVRWDGYCNIKDDVFDVFAYNYITAAYEQVGTIIGVGGTTVQTENFPYTISHVGIAGADFGKVRFRILTASGAAAGTDRVLCSYAVIPVSRQTKGTVVDATPTAGNFDTDVTQPDGHWDDALVTFTTGVLAFQTRPLAAYLNASGNMTFNSGVDQFTAAPANGDTFVINHDHVHPVVQIQAGLATTANLEARTPTAAQLADIIANSTLAVPVTFTSGTTTTAVLALVDGSAASATNDQYKGRLLAFNSGTLDEVVTDITGYVGATKTATFTTIPTAVTSGHTARLV